MSTTDSPGLLEGDTCRPAGGVLETLIARVEELSRTVAALEREPVGTSPWLDTDGAAKYLSSTPAALRKMVQRRAIPVHRAGGRLLYDRRELDGYVRGGEES